MIAAFAKAGRVLNKTAYIQKATAAAAFILNRLLINKRLHRSFALGKTKYSAYLVDYCYLIYGLIELYQASFDPKWLSHALKLQSLQDQLFLDTDTGTYFETDGLDKTLLIRPKDFYDGATPSGNSVSTLNLLRLASLTYNENYRTQANRLIQSTYSTIKRHPPGYSLMLQAIDYLLDSSKEVAIIGDLKHPKTQLMLQALSTTYLPNMVLAVGSPEKKTAANEIKLLSAKSLINNQHGSVYVCSNKTCKLPTTDIYTALKLANSPKLYKIK